LVFWIFPVELYISQDHLELQYSTMKFKTLFLSLILASSLLSSFNTYALSVVEDGCNPDEDILCTDDCKTNTFAMKGLFNWPPNHWCALKDKEQREGDRKEYREKAEEEARNCANPTLNHFLELKGKNQQRFFANAFIGSCNKWISPSFLLKRDNKAIKWLAQAVEQGDTGDWAIGWLINIYSGYAPSILGGYITPNKEKANYWKSRREALKEGKQGTIKAAKNKPNGKPKNKPKAGGVGTGTGFVVTKDGVIATAEHVVNGCNKIEVDNLEASIVVADDKNDIALIKVNKTYKDIASIKVRSPKLGDDVMVFGYPLSGILSSIHVSLTKGSVSSLAGMRDDTSRFRYTAASQPGNSGGPIVDDKGMVVGIVSAGLKNDKSLDVNWQNVNFGVRSSLLVNLMDSKNIPITTQEIPKEEIIGHYEKVSKYIKCFK